MEKVAALLVISLISISSGTDVPALIWSPNRPLSDLPDVFAGHAVSTADFQNKYLRPLSSGDVTALVVFLQDKLSLDDFTHYADVYNPDSNGGAFENVKEFMDEHFSVQLPQVKSPSKALETLQKTYSGKVQELEAPYDVNSLSLVPEKTNLIVVHLPKTQTDAPAKSIVHSDKLIAKVLSGLARHEVKYTAIYTAHSPSQETADPLTYKGRHLLQEPTPPPEPSGPGYNESLWVNDTQCGALYALGLQIVYYENGAKKMANLAKITDRNFQCGNASDPTGNEWTLMFDKPANVSISNITLRLNFTIKPMTQNMDWYIANAVLSYTGKLSQNDSGDSTELEFNAMDIWAPRGMSYHCAVPDPIRQLNTSMSNVTLLFRKLQVQPFDVKNGRFGLPWDCVGFFTAPIWMALFSIIILLIILAYGLWMILSINVMDRFDDSKGKTITINAQE
ncbi:V-type proton ATPase subunit S1-like [Liolophura sinensis]|uniref:V-type proton ATPase subunit S1-like n=1 Tax=Liolophura sinensis TaxID=3198878 RepID=UPI003158F55A